MAKRAVSFESPEGNELRTQVEADVVDRFVRAATDKEGSFRGSRQTFQDALESAVTTAFLKFVEK